jgi:hypothetical protein
VLISFSPILCYPSLVKTTLAALYLLSSGLFAQPLPHNKGFAHSTGVDISY